MNIIKDITIKEDSFVRTAPVFNQKDPKTIPTDPMMNPQTAKLCEALGIDDPVQVVVARTGRRMKEPYKIETTVESPVYEATSIIATTPTHILKCSKLSLPAPVTPNVDEIELESEDVLSANDSSVTGCFNTTEEFSTPVTKKTFKRRNMSIYNTPDKDESEGSASTLLGSEESPSKLSCKPNQP